MMPASRRITWEYLLETLRRDARFYEEVARHRAVRVQPHGLDLRVDLDRTGLTQQTQQWLCPRPMHTRRVDWSLDAC